MRGLGKILFLLLLLGSSRIAVSASPCRVEVSEVFGGDDLSRSPQSKSNFAKQSGTCRSDSRRIPWRSPFILHLSGSSQWQKALPLPNMNFPDTLRKLEESYCAAPRPKNRLSEVFSSLTRSCRDPGARETWAHSLEPRTLSDRTGLQSLARAPKRSRLRAGENSFLKQKGATCAGVKFPKPQAQTLQTFKIN